MEQNAAKDDKQKPGEGAPKIIYLANDGTAPNTRKCPSCGKDVAVDAAKCPNCQSELESPSKSGSKLPGDEPGSFDSLGYVKSALASKYEVLETVAKTNTAMVFRAFHVQLGKEVALKVLLRSIAQDRGYSEAFHRRFRAIDKLSQSNIIRIYDEGVENGVHYAAMEFLKGIDLEKRILQFGPLPADTMISILMPAVSALGHAHRNAIVHGNIKCSSIFLHSDGRIILTGFGTQNSSVGNRVAFKRDDNSYEYISPEEASNQGADGRSDVYSLGVVMYRALTGRFPFVGETPEAITKAVIATQHVPAGKLKVIPQWLDNVINRCLQKDASKRVQSCGELALLLNAGANTPRTSAAAYTKTETDAKAGVAPSMRAPDIAPPAEKIEARPVSQPPRTNQAPIPPPKPPAPKTSEPLTEEPTSDRGSPKNRPSATAKPVGGHQDYDDEAASGGKRHVVPWLVGVIILLAAAAGTYFMMNKGTSSQNPIVAPGQDKQRSDIIHDRSSSPASESANSTMNKTAEENGASDLKVSGRPTPKEQAVPSATMPAEESSPPSDKRSKPAEAKSASEKRASRGGESRQEQVRKQPEVVYVLVPDLTGNQLNVAERILSLNGLNVGQITMIPDPSNDGLVVREVPKPGTKLEKGSTVNLIVGSK